MTIEYFPKSLSNLWGLDIETDSLRPTVIHCIVVTNAETGECRTFSGPSLSRIFIEWLRPEYTFIGHNAISFDIPVINRLFELDINLHDRVIDTLVLGYLYRPHLTGGHSLEAWGTRLGLPKIEFNDYSRYSSEMLEYCKRDVELTLRVYKALRKKMTALGFSNQSMWIEHGIRIVIDRQERNGFWFDIDRAKTLYSELRKLENEAREKIQKVFPPVLVPVKTYAFRVTTGGSPFASYLRHLETYPEIKMSEDGSEYTVYDWQTFNLGSPKQRVERLMSLGWVPTKFTDKGNPKVDEDSILEFAETHPNVKPLADFLVVNGRANMVNTWINAYNPETHCIHGRVMTCGAGSRRMTHNSPNSANIPDTEVPYGREVRSLWRARPGRVMLGVDQKSAQMRMFGHYLNNEETAKRYINGDPHQDNADAFGDSKRRKKAKNVFFAFIFGAAAPKLGLTWGGSERDGRRIKKALFGNTPGLRELTDSIDREFNQKGGWLVCIDGGYVWAPSPHAALCYKIQAAEKASMALASILLFDRAAHLDYLKVGDIHDEWQFDCANESVANELGELAVRCIQESGEILGFSVPLDGEYKIGETWAETH